MEFAEEQKQVMAPPPAPRPSSSSPSGPSPYIDSDDDEVENEEGDDTEGSTDKSPKATSDDSELTEEVDMELHGLAAYASVAARWGPEPPLGTSRKQLVVSLKSFGRRQHRALADTPTTFTCCEHMKKVHLSSTDENLYKCGGTNGRILLCIVMSPAFIGVIQKVKQRVVHEMIDM